FFFSSRRRHTRSKRDWSSDVCSSDLSTNAIPVMIVIARNRPSTSPANVEPLSGSHQCMRLSPRLVHLAAKLKSAVLVSLPATVTEAVCAPYFSCHASIVYVPGGRPLIVKLPSPPLTPKNGCGNTASHACIHPCTLHSSATMTSGLSNVFVEVITAGWLMLKGRLAFAFALMLCRMPSEFLIASVWPTWMPSTCGW